MIDYLGILLRSLHPVLMSFMFEMLKNAKNYPTAGQVVLDGNNFFDRQTYVSVTKCMTQLITIAPYASMRSKIAGVFVQGLVENVQFLDYVGNRDTLLKNEIFSALTATFSRAELLPLIQSRLLAENANSQFLRQSLVNSLLKVQNFMPQEKITILIQLGKHVPEIMTDQWLKIDKGF